MPSLSAISPDLFSIQLLPAPEDACWNPPYCKISGPCVGADKAPGTFGVSAVQYSPFYRTPAMRNLSAVPVTAHFDGARYRAKKPMPAPNTFVSVEGFVTRVDGVTGAVGAIHISVDNLAFLGKANISPPPRAPGSCHSRCGGLHTNFLRSRDVVCRAIQVSIRLWWTAAAAGSSVPDTQPSRAVSSSVSEH
jgi:hypothetical protein